MKVLVIQNCAREGIGIYEQYLKEKKIPHSIFHSYKNGQFPKISEYDAIIVGGTPISANDFHKFPYLKREWGFLKKWVKSGKPYFGICCGGQILARLLGAKVMKNPVMEIGGYDTKLTPSGRKDKMFKNFPRTFPVFHWHGWTFMVPKNARLLVEGVDCKNQAFRSGKRLALQFHLEVDSAEAAKWAKRYQNEIPNVKKSINRVVEECKNREKRMNRLAYTLLDNFFELAKKR